MYRVADRRTSPRPPCCIEPNRRQPPDRSLGGSERPPTRRRLIWSSNRLAVCWVFVNKNLLTRVLAVRVQKEGGSLHLRVEDEGACCKYCSMRGRKRLGCVISRSAPSALAAFPRAGEHARLPLFLPALLDSDHHNRRWRA